MAARTPECSDCEARQENFAPGFSYERELRRIPAELLVSKTALGSDSLLLWYWHS